MSHRSGGPSSAEPVRLAVLASGSGTILDAMLEGGLPVGLVVADRPCRALAVARQHGVTDELVERTSFGADFDRAAYTRRLVDVLSASAVDLIAMAGFGTILGEAMYERFGGRVLNTHPSLLPAFPGWHAVEQAIDYGVKVTGCTVHVATREVDAGPILAQEVVRVRDDDTVDSLHERIKTVERRLYIETIEAIVAEGSVPA